MRVSVFYCTLQFVTVGCILGHFFLSVYFNFPLETQHSVYLCMCVSPDEAKGKATPLQTWTDP
jgi:hypothetical protein